MVLIISLILVPIMQVPPQLLMAKGLSFFSEMEILVSYLMDGTEEWRRNIQKDYGDFCFQWTFSSTPTLFGKVNFTFPFCNEMNSTW